MASIRRSNRKLLEEMGDVIGRSRKIAIVTHTNPDPDAIAAAYGMRYLLLHHFNKRSVIVYDGVIGRAENRALVKLLRIPMRTAARFPFYSYSTYIMVDAQPGAGNNAVPATVKPAIVIDHHPLRRKSIKSTFHDLRPSAGATSTLITQYLRAAKVEVPQTVATALFFGIRTDTLDLSRRASSADYRAYRYLFPLVDHRLLTRIEHPELSPSFFHAAGTAIDQALCYGNLIFSNLGSVPVAETIPQMADYLAQLDGVHWSAVIGQVNGELRLSLRTSNTRGDAGAVLKRVVGKRGTAGGHGVAAGGRIDISNTSPQNIKGLERSLEQRMVKLLASRKADPIPLRDLKS